MATRPQRPLPYLPHSTTQHVMHCQRHARRVRCQIKRQHHRRIERIGIAGAQPMLRWLRCRWRQYCC